MWLVYKRKYIYRKKHLPKAFNAVAVDTNVDSRDWVDGRDWVAADGLGNAVLDDVHDTASSPKPARVAITVARRKLR